MKKQTFRSICFVLCVLLSMMLGMTALAQSADLSAEPTEAPKPVALAILLDGEPVKNTVLNLSVTNQMQFTATEPVTWKSSKTYRGTIDADGLFTSVTSGTLVVTAKTADGRTASCEVKMSRLLTDITITGSHDMAAGKKITLKAATAPSNAANKSVVWSSSDTSVATVNSYGTVTAKSVSGTRNVTIRATAKDGSGVYAEHVITVRPAAKSISILRGSEVVSTVSLDLSGEAEAQLSAVVLPEDAGQSVTWKSSSSRVSVDEDGKITGKRTGSATITATAADGSGRSTSIKVQVVRMVKEITLGGSSSVTGGKSITLSKSVLPSDATQKTLKWSSSDESVATVDRNGKVTAKKLNEVRTVVITAAATDGSGVTAQHIVTVTPSIASMVITREDEEVKTLTVDINQPVVDLGVKILPADACQDVSWTTSSSSRATVTEEGIVTVKRIGSVTITATAKDGSGKKATVKLNVVRPVESITVTGATSLVGKQSGKVRASVLPSNATNTDVIWSSSDSSVLTVNKYGSLQAANVDAMHQVTITATAKDGSGVIGERVITVVPLAKKAEIKLDGETVSALTIDLNTCSSIDLDAVITPDDASQEVKWSSNSTRAKVDSEGVVTFSKTGSATITAAAKDGSRKQATVKITIIRAVESVSVSGDTLVAGGQKGDLDETVLPSNATNKSVTWSSSDPQLLSVDKYGSYTAAKVDSVQEVTVTATAKDGSGVVGSTVVTILPRTQRIAILHNGEAAENVGVDLGGSKTAQLTAQIEPADAMQQVRWTSSNTRYATVDANGLVTGHRAGTVTITATAADGTGVRGSVTVTVGTMVKSLTITGALQVTGGNKIDLNTVAYPSNATKKTVTWSSSDPALAKINTSGEVSTVAVAEPKQVIITATAKDGSGVTAQHTLTVVPKATGLTIERVDVPTANVLILERYGGTAQLQAVIAPASASQGVKWKSGNSNVASVDSNGRVVANAPGTTTITATASDGSGVKATILVGVGKAGSMPYYLEVDRANQVVRIYERGEDASYSKLIKRMVCSTGREGLPVPKAGLYAMDGQKLYWMDGVAMYATRVKDHFLLHSVTYLSRSMSNLNAEAYGMLGSKASAGCIRLLTGDAKWIYDNVPKGCFLRYVTGERDINEYSAVDKKPALGVNGWDPTNPDPNNPDFDPTYTSDVTE